MTTLRPKLFSLLSTAAIILSASSTLQAEEKLGVQNAGFEEPKLSSNVSPATPFYTLPYPDFITTDGISRNLIPFWCFSISTEKERSGIISRSASFQEGSERLEPAEGEQAAFIQGKGNLWQIANVRPGTWKIKLQARAWKEANPLRIALIIEEIAGDFQPPTEVESLHLRFTGDLEITPTSKWTVFTSDPFPITDKTIRFRISGMGEETAISAIDEIVLVQD